MAADTEDQVTDSGEEKEVTTPTTPKSEPKPKEEAQPKEESKKAEVKGRPNFDFI